MGKYGVAQGRFISVATIGAVVLCIQWGLMEVKVTVNCKVPNHSTLASVFVCLFLLFSAGFAPRFMR